jgi:hypothetical protein
MKSPRPPDFNAHVPYTNYRRKLDQAYQLFYLTELIACDCATCTKRP